MADEQNIDLADLGAQFGTQNDETVSIEDEEVNLSEDLEGFAKGFPSWNLEPPKEKS
jgi:hypothetical protein